MSQSNDGRKKSSSAAEQRAAEAEQQRAAKALLTQDLDDATSAAEKLEKELRVVRKSMSDLEALSSHLDGFYSEIDKLTKGKSLIPVTDLLVERVNEIICDAKAILVGDKYLDRVKEFVPAGDNPVYPDVLMTSRVIRESLARFRERLEGLEKRLSEMFWEAKTIQAAVRHYLDKEEVPSKKQIQDRLGEFVSREWFSYDSQRGVECFDFERLDSWDPNKYSLEDGGREARPA
jgi:hypothetical protein